VIIYLIDALRADRLGLYGHDQPTSPVMDALAEDGVVFERAYAMDSRTLGSVPSLLASLSTPSHGLLNYGQRLAPEIVTLSTVFRAAGYDTASFVTNRVGGRLTGLDRGFAQFYNAVTTHGNRGARRSFPDGKFFNWMDRIDAGRSIPFFAYVHTAEPHEPYIPPPRILSLFESDYQGTVTGFFQDADGFKHATDPRDIAHVRALYDGEVRFADAALGRMLAGLEERRLRASTLIVVTSDHGEELKDHGHWSHGHSVYDELLRVPLIVTGPGVPAGRRIRELVQLIDVAPTILDVAGIPRPEVFEGESLLGLITGEREERLEGKAIFTRTTLRPRKAVVIEDRWKCIFKEGGAIELYDLEDDPGETRNLAEVEHERAAALFARLRSWMDGAGGTRGAPRMELSEDDVEALRALGYIE
jgi:arylsulfatase A-like enzyme